MCADVRSNKRNKNNTQAKKHKEIGVKFYKTDLYIVYPIVNEIRLTLVLNNITFLFSKLEHL